MPVDAVMSAGRASVSSGSTSATVAAIRGLPTLNLNDRAASVMTDQKVTSLPVPAVVGMVIKGGIAFCTIPRPSYSRISPPFVTITPIALAVSIGLPPPRATMASQPSESASFAPLLTDVFRGLGTTSSKTTVPMFASASEPSTGSSRPAATTPGSVTTKTRVPPRPFTASPTCVAGPVSEFDARWKLETETLHIGPSVSLQQS